MPTKMASQQREYRRYFFTEGSNVYRFVIGSKAKQGNREENESRVLIESGAEDWRKTNDGGFESQSQAFGRAAHDSGAEGILVPSARISGASNLVYFPESLSKSDAVEILGQEELERWLKKK